MSIVLQQVTVAHPLDGDTGDLTGIKKKTIALREIQGTEEPTPASPKRSKKDRNLR